MLLVHHYCAEPTLPQMPGPAMPRVDETGVAPMRVGKRATQTVLVRRHNDDVNMVGHQAIGPDLGCGPTSGIAEQIEIKSVIAVLEEGLLPAIAALGHVLGIAGQDEARETSHAAHPSELHSSRRPTGSTLVHLVNCHRNSGPEDLSCACLPLAVQL